MHIIEIPGRLSVSRIAVGEHLGNLARYLGSRNAVILTDAHVDRRYGREFPEAPKIVLEPGEISKTLAVVEQIYRQLLTFGADRSSVIVGIGGGCVCDIAGFAASTYMRGLQFGFAATTLLAQVDASIGGKNGVNLDGFKNIVGVFGQPEFVLCDPGTLRTLPEQEIRNGFAEVVKYGLIGAPSILALLEERSREMLSLEPGVIARIVQDCIWVKAEIVGRDEREAGERKVLNFGHTLAHALEATSPLSHGEAVAVGMVFALKMSSRMGILADPSLPHRLLRLLELYGLPALAAADPARVAEALIRDKKKDGGDIDFVFLEGLGRPRLQKIPLPILKDMVFDLCQPS